MKSQSMHIQLQLCLCYSPSTSLHPAISMKCLIDMVIVPQTVLALRGSHGVGIEGAMVVARIRPWTPPLIFVAIYSTW